MNNNQLKQIQHLLTTLISLVQQQIKEKPHLGVVSQKELLSILDIAPNTLKNWEKNGLPRLEPPIEGTRTVYYKLSDILDFLEN